MGTSRVPCGASSRGTEPKSPDGVRHPAIAVDIVDRGGFDDPTGVHHQRAVGEFTHHAQIVGDQQYPGAGHVACGFEHLEDLRLHGDVERGGRLVADQQVGIVGDRDRDHHALAFATGQLVRKRTWRAAPAARCQPVRAIRPRADGPHAFRCAAGAPRWLRRSDRRRCRPASAPTSGPGRPCRSCCRETATWRRRVVRSARCPAAAPNR